MRAVCLPVALVVLFGCAGEDGAREAESDSRGMTEPAAVEILRPSSGDTLGPDVLVVLRAHGVEVEPALGEKLAGSGHHHLFVDVDVTPEGEPIPKQTEGIIHLGTGAGNFTVKGLAPGEHRIIAVLAYGDHVPMEGVAQDTVRIVVRP